MPVERLSRINTYYNAKCSSDSQNSCPICNLRQPGCTCDSRKEVPNTPETYVPINISSLSHVAIDSCHHPGLVFMDMEGVFQNPLAGMYLNCSSFSLPDALSDSRNTYSKASNSDAQPSCSKVKATPCVLAQERLLVEASCIAACCSASDNSSPI